MKQIESYSEIQALYNSCKKMYVKGTDESYVVVDPSSTTVLTLIRLMDEGNLFANHKDCGMVSFYDLEFFMLIKRKEAKVYRRTDEGDFFEFSPEAIRGMTVSELINIINQRSIYYVGAVKDQDRLLVPC